MSIDSGGAHKDLVLGCLLLLLLLIAMIALVSWAWGGCQ